eukprot:UN03531
MFLTYFLKKFISKTSWAFFFETARYQLVLSQSWTSVLATFLQSENNSSHPLIA